MFEKIVSETLARYLGDYIEGLDAKNLSITLWSGEASLGDLKMKEDALNRLDLPVTVKGGFIGRIKLSIPWTRLKTDSIIIEMQQVFILCGPKPPSQWDAKGEKQREQKMKQEKLNLAKLLKSRGEAPEEITQPGAIEATMTKILDNLQFRISDVHLRYEDSEEGFSAGFTLDQLTANSCDENWKPTFLNMPHTIIHKIISLKNLSVYWNPKDTPLKYTSTEEMGRVMHAMIHKDGNAPLDLHYILQPISGSLKVRLRKKNALDASIPKYTVTSEFDEMALSLEQLQYRQLMTLLDSFTRYNAGRYSKFPRPVERPTKDPKSWWKFAYTCISSDIQEKKSKMNWDFFLNRRATRLEYIELYKAAHRDMPHDFVRLQQLEEELSIEDIFLFQAQAEASLKHEDASEVKQTDNSWWGWAVGKFGYNSESLKTAQDNTTLQTYFFDLIEYDEKAADLVADTGMTLHFLMKAGSVTLKSTKSNEIVSLSFDSLGIALRQRKDFFSVDVRLDSMELLDRSTVDTAFPRLISPNRSTSSTDDNRPFFELIYVDDIHNPNYDYKLQLRMLPLQIYLNKNPVDRFVSFFNKSESAATRELEIEARRYLEDLNFDASKLFAPDKRKIMHLDINIAAPKVIVPENIKDPEALRLIVDLGELHIRSDMQRSTLALEDAYDKFDLGLSSIQLFMAYGSKKVKDDPQKRIQLVEKFDINILFHHRVNKDLSQTQFKIFADLPMLDIKVSLDKISKLIKILSIMTGPKQEALTVRSTSVLPRSESVLPPPERKGKIPKKDILQTIAETRSLQCYISIPKVIVSVSLDNQQDLVKLQLSGLYAQLTQRTFDTQVFACLSEVLLEDLLQKRGENFRYLATSHRRGDNFMLDSDYNITSPPLREEEAANMIQASIILTQKESPNFDGFYATASFQFNTLYVMCNRETVVHLIESASSVQTALNDAFGAAPAPNNAVQAPVAPKPAQESSVKIMANLKEFSLQLNREGRKLAVCTLSKTSLIAQVSSTGMRVKGNLGRVSLKDCMAKRKDLRYIFNTRDSHIVDFCYQTFSEKRHNYDSLLGVRTNTAQLIYVPRFFQDLQAYANSITTMRRLLSKTATKAAEAAKEAVETVSKKAMKFEIEIGNPKIVFPDDTGVINADLGQISVSNDFLTSTSENVETLLERIDILALDINLQSEIQTPVGPRKELILANTNVSFQVEAPRTNLKEHHLPERTVIGKISEIQVSLTEAQYDLLVGVIRENFFSQSQNESQDKPEEGPSNDVLVLEQPQEQWETFRLAISCQHISMELIKGDGTILVNGVKNSVVAFQIAELVYNAVNFSDRSSKTDFTMDAIVLADQRPDSTNQWRQLLGAGHKKSSHEQVFRMHMKERSDGHQKYGIHIHHLRALVIPEALFAIHQFIQPGIDALSFKTPEKRKEVSPVNASKKTMELKLNVTDPEICLLENATLKNSRALTLNSTFLIKFTNDDNIEKKGVKCLISQLQINKCVMLQPDSTVSILEPMDIAFDYLRTKKENPIFNFIFDNINITFSYRDFVLLNKVIDSFSVFKTPTDHSSNKTVQVAPPSRAKKMTMKTGGLRCTFIDDCNKENVPLLDVEFSNLIMEVVVSESIFVTSLVKVDYYNPRISVWEPVIEPWNAELSIQFTPAPGTRHVLKSRERLNLNLTKEFFDTALNTIGAWRNDYYNQAEFSYRPLSHPFIIRNETGLKLKYWYNDQNAERLLESGREEAIPIPKLNSKQRETSMDLNTILNGIQVIPWTKISNLPMSRVGVYKLALVPKPQDANPNLIYEVCYKEGSKIIIIKSNVCINNRTTVPLEVKLKVPNQQPKVVVLGPDESYCVPVDMTRVPLEFRPQNTTFGWSDVIFPAVSVNTLIRCPGIYPTESFYFQIKTDLVDPKDLNGEHSLNLHPPLIIVNKLPEEVDYKIVDKRTGVQIQGAVKANQEKQLYKVNLDETTPPSLKITIGGFDWSNPVTIEASAESSILKVLDEKKSPLNLYAYISKSSSGGLKVYVHSKYLFVNRTGLRLLYRATALDDSFNSDRLAAGQSTREVDDYSFMYNRDPREWYDASRTAALATPFMYSYNSSNLFEVKTLVKIGNSAWSKAGLSLESPGVLSYLEIPGKYREGQPQKLFELGVSININPEDKLGTKTVTFVPRFVLVNNTEQTLHYRQRQEQQFSLGGSLQKGNFNVDYFALAPKESVPFHWFDKSLPKEICISLEHCLWSGGLSINQLGDFSAKIVYDPNDPHPVSRKRRGKPYLARVHIRFEKSTFLVIINKESPEYPPYRIQNFSKATILVSQEMVGIEEVLTPYQSIPYAWDEPALNRRVVMRIKGSDYRDEFSLDIFRLYTAFTVQVEGQDGKEREMMLKVEVLADGPTKIMKIIDTDLHREATTNSMQRAVKADLVDTEWIVDVAGLGISIVDSTPRELSFISVDRIKVAYSNSNNFQLLDVNVNYLQVDNQLDPTPFPIVLAPKSTDEDSFKLKMAKSNVFQHMDYFTNFSIFLQAMELKIDEVFFTLFSKFIGDLINFIEKILFPTSTQAPTTTQDGILLDPSSLVESRKVYFENLQIFPVKVSLSYASTPSSDPANFSLVATVLSAIGATLANVEGAPLYLRALDLHNPYTTWQELIDIIYQHYQQQAIRQLYKIVGAMDILLNPVSFVNNLGTVDFSKGITQGSVSLAKNLLHTVFNPAGKWTSSLSKGLATLSMDEDYVKHRELARWEKPAFLGDAFTSGLKDFTIGVYSGITGIITQPWMAMQQDGASGLIQGAMRGGAGFFVKPVVSAFDFATNVSEAIARSTRLMTPHHRFRPPRFLGPDRALQSYSLEKSYGQAILHRMESGRHLDEFYLFHYFVGTNVLLVSDEKIMFLNHSTLHIKWSIDLKNVKRVEENKESVIIYLNVPYGGSSHILDRRIHISDNRDRTWVVNQLEQILHTEKLKRS